MERAERFAGGWDDTWFVEDYFEGPGQALIVNPRGEVKPCCGFASDLDQLTIGNIYRDTVRKIVRRARRHPYVGKVFREGLTAIRDEILARDPNALPGAAVVNETIAGVLLSPSLMRCDFQATDSRPEPSNAALMSDCTESPSWWTDPQDLVPRWRA